MGSFAWGVKVAICRLSARDSLSLTPHPPTRFDGLYGYTARRAEVTRKNAAIPKRIPLQPSPCQRPHAERAYLDRARPRLSRMRSLRPVAYTCRVRHPDRASARVAQYTRGKQIPVSGIGPERVTLVAADHLLVSALDDKSDRSTCQVTEGNDPPRIYSTL